MWTSEKNFKHLGDRDIKQLHHRRLDRYGATGIAATEQ
jgi:hypothetical protein